MNYHELFDGDGNGDGDDDGDDWKMRETAIRPRCWFLTSPIIDSVRHLPVHLILPKASSSSQKTTSGLPTHKNLSTWSVQLSQPPPYIHMEYMKIGVLYLVSL